MLASLTRLSASLVMTSAPGRALDDNTIPLSRSGTHPSRSSNRIRCERCSSERADAMTGGGATVVPVARRASNLGCRRTVAEASRARPSPGHQHLLHIGGALLERGIRRAGQLRLEQMVSERDPELSTGRHVIDTGHDLLA